MNPVSALRQNPFSSARSRAADLVLEQLLALGVSHYFGIPGGPAAPTFGALGSNAHRLRYVPVQDERAAGHSADAFFRVSGSLAACVLTAGPGITNADTAFHTARLDGSAMFALAATTPLRWAGRDCAQGLDLVAVLAPAMKRRGSEPGFEILTDPRGGPAVVRRLVALATSGVPGPVALVIPPDVGAAWVEDPSGLVEAARAPRATTPPDAAAVAETARLLVQARRPVIVAGYGVVLARAAAQLIWLAEHLGIPVVTSARAKGVFPEHPFHPLGRGVLGLGGRASALDAVAEADVLFAVGEPLGDLTSNGFSGVFGEKTLIQLDVDAAAIGRNYPVHLGLVADARVGLDAVCRAVVDRSGPIVLTTPAPRAQAPQPTLEQLVATAGEAPLKPRLLMRLLSHLVPQHAHVLADIGSAAMVWSAQELRRLLPYRYHLPQKLGAMGSAIDAALGAALATDEPVFLLAGDGAFAQKNGAELRSAVQAGVHYTAIMVNDGGFGMVQEGWDLLGGCFPSAMYPEPIEIAKVALATGAAAFEVRTAAQLVEAVRAADGLAGPVVIEVHVVRDPNDPTPMSARVATFEA
jgi:acetolactate synthase-1/2/3 large subunit